MHSSICILIAFLVVGVYSLNRDSNNTIFGVEINKNQLNTLNIDKVEQESKAKRLIIGAIDDLEKKVPTDERDWIGEFRKMVNAEREIIEKLSLPLSHLNTDNLDNINSDELKGKMSKSALENIQSGLENYLIMLKTFHFDGTVWANRTFLGNPFTKFLAKINEKNPETLKATPLHDAFKQAAAQVLKIQKAINAIISSFKNKLSTQNQHSQKVMTEIRELNLYAVQSTDDKVSRAIKSLLKELKTLKSAIENVNNIPAVLQCVMQKRSWLDEISLQLDNLDTVHKNLDTAVAQLQD